MIIRRLSSAVALACAGALAALIIVEAPAVAAPGRNVCALLTAAEIQSVAPGVHVGDGVASTDPIGSLNCRYLWEAGDRTPGRLNVTVGDATRWFPGMSPDLIRQGVLKTARPGTADAVIRGVGEAAVFTSDAPIRAKTLAYLKGRILNVELEGPGARGKKDQVIALLRSAAGRI